MSDIAGAIAEIERDIATIAKEHGRDPGSARLMAVTKTQPVKTIEDSLRAGQRLFGENKVQEAAQHWQDLRARWPDVEVHLIGPLQSNKAGDAVRLFDCIQTVDRPSLVDALAKEMQKQGRAVACMVQVNTGEETQKAGVAPAELEALLQDCQTRGVTIVGLMCIPPQDEPPALHFALLQKLARRHGLAELSMGMSGDYAKAVPLGATIVRVGTAIFGARDGAGLDQPVGP